MNRRDDIVAAARGWIGTPYRHQASAKGAGADCLGLIRGVWREVLGGEPQDTPAYTPDWDEVAKRDVLLDAAERLLQRQPRNDLRPGQVLLFRMRRDAPAKHLGILSAAGDAPRFVHAYSKHGVVETSLSSAWASRLAGVFAFPEGDL